MFFRCFEFLPPFSTQNLEVEFALVALPRTQELLFNHVMAGSVELKSDAAP